MVYNSGNMSVDQKDMMTFERVMSRIKTHIGNEAFQSWFGRVKLEQYDKLSVVLSVPTSFLRSWISNHYGNMLLSFWQEETPSIVRIDFTIRGVDQVKNPQLAANLKNGSASAGFTNKKIESNGEEKLLGSPLDKRYVFENFVQGASNRLAYLAALSVAQGDKNCEQFSPLFVYSKVGLGKTHLLQAIATKAKDDNKYGNVVYLTAEYFMWRFASAIRDNKILHLKEQMRDIHLLIIDDLQFLQGKSIQNEFCHLLNSLLDSAKHVVVAADRQPSELEALDSRVRSRLQRGVILEIGYPDYDTRLAMLKNRVVAAQENNSNIDIDDGKLQHIAQNISGSGRDIEGIMNQIIFRQSFEKTISIEDIDAIINQFSSRGETRRVRIEEIQQVVARHYNVSKQELLSSRRVRTIVKPRQIAMYLAKNLTTRSLPEIGRRFGGRDHTTVLHAIRKIEDLVSKDSTLDKELEILKRLINEQSA